MKRREFLKSIGLLTLATGTAGAAKASKPQRLMSNHPSCHTIQLFMTSWELRYDHMYAILKKHPGAIATIHPCVHGRHEYAIIRIEDRSAAYNRGGN